MNTAAIAKPCEDVQGDSRWMSQHNRFVLEAKEREPEVLFIGDSLVRDMGVIELWKSMFEQLHCLNFGIGGDQTQNVLWRIQNGELENLAPKVVVLLIGTNNHGHTAEEVVGGIVEIVRVIQQKQPDTHVIVMGIPPRGENPNPLREKIAAVNAGLASELKKLTNKSDCTFLPTDPALFVNSDGRISATDMYDYLHLTREGYTKLCEPLLEAIQLLLKDFLKVENISQDADSIGGDLAS